MMRSISWGLVYGSMSFWICSGEVVSVSESEDVSIGGFWGRVLFFFFLVFVMVFLLVCGLLMGFCFFVDVFTIVAENEGSFTVQTLITREFNMTYNLTIDVSVFLS